VTVIGSDRTTLGMFNDFLKSTFWKNMDFKTVDISCLLSTDFQISQFEESAVPSKNTLFRYFLEKNFILNLPANFLKKSDLVLQFPYGATSPVILEDKTGQGISVKERWDSNINKMAGQR